MANINVDALDATTFRVTISEGSSSTTHEVTISPQDVERLGRPAPQLIAASIRFLLDREPKESIMRQFDLSVISRYFPEYASAIEEYL